MEIKKINRLIFHLQRLQNKKNSAHHKIIDITINMQILLLKHSIRVNIARGTIYSIHQSAL